MRSPASAASPVAAQADFGNVFYHDIAKIPFADLYETLRSVPAQVRSHWLAEIEQASEGPRKIAALCGFLRALVQIDPVEAGDLVVHLKRHRSPAMDAMISAALPSAMPQLVNMLLKLPPEVRNYALTDHLAIVIDEWAQIDPHAVTRFFDVHKEIPIQEYSASFLKNWAGIDAQAAWKWLEAQSKNVSPFSVESWLTGWFDADPEAATNYALTHVQEEKLHSAIEALVPELFQQDKRKAQNFVDRLPTKELRQGALTRIADLGSPLSLNEWPAPDAASFIVQFPPTEWPENLSNVIGRWRDVAASELVGWIAQLPPEARNNVIERFPAPSSFEPEYDFLPLLELSDSSVRSKLLRQMVQRLGSETQSAPKEAFARLRLSPEQKAELAAFLPEAPTP